MIIEHVGNVIFIEDLRLGGVYVPESAIVNPEEALTPSGETKPGYLKFQNFSGVVVCARDEFYRDRFGVVYKTEYGWYRRNSEAPWEMLPDGGPELCGTVTMMHLNYGSYSVTDEETDEFESTTVYFIG